MAKMPHAPAENAETACSACGATFKAPIARRRRRVQCPKCREVVFIEAAPTNEPEPEVPVQSVTPPSPPPAPPASEDRSRIEALEARVEALEAALRDAMAALQAPAPGAPARKFIWVASEPPDRPSFSQEQGQALFYNLGKVRTQAITIRTPAYDHAARTHAEWFKSVFERAGWTVHGPEEVEPGAAARGLSLAVPELPVAKQAAATYFALKAAGFEAVPVLDSALIGIPGEETAPMALTVPSGRAA